MQIREKYYDLWAKKLQIHLNAQIEWGKWLVASLLLVHGGALVAIVQNEEHSVTLMKAAGHWFVWGLVAALVTGFITWVNWTVLASIYEDWADPAAIVDDDAWPEEPNWKRKIVTLTFVLSLLAGFASVGFLVYGATQIQAALPSK